jgi:hypothetical protein
MALPTKLVILPCHSIWRGGSGHGDSREEWELADFQIQGYDHLCFKDHIHKSIEYTQCHPEAYLVISGGQTKRKCGPVSESQSYYQLAKKLYPEFDFDRSTTEEFARDSFENVLFLICRFFEVHGKYPESVVVIGFEFKRDRFVKLHLKQALRFPVVNVEYIGNLPEPRDLDETDTKLYFDDLHQSEFKYAVAPFQSDWYGNQDVLVRKKSSRNPFNRTHGYQLSNPLLSGFFKALATSDSSSAICERLDGVSWVRE